MAMLHDEQCSSASDDEWTVEIVMRRLMQERDLSCNYEKRTVIMYYRCDCVDCCDAIVLWFHLLMSSSGHVPVMRRLMQTRHVSRYNLLLMWLRWFLQCYYVVVSFANEFVTSCSCRGLRPQHAMPAALQALPGLEFAVTKDTWHAVRGPPVDETLVGPPESAKVRQQLCAKYANSCLYT